ncbi:MAG: DinB family protein [Chloroflexi bacterium]|nr:DinB family protein [Chloroflexota bacterium]
MKITPREIEAHLATLQSTPAVLSRVSSDLDDVRLRQRPQPGQWSLIELLAHLSACAEIWGDDIQEMLSCDIPTLTKPHPRGVMNEARFRERSFEGLLASFAALRDELLRVIVPLESAQWARSAMINGRPHTVFSQVRRMALHEASHYDQLHAIRSAITAK